MIKNKALVSIVFIILFIQISSQALDIEKIRKDSELCQAHKDKNSCTSVRLYSGFYQCCKATTEFLDQSLSFCSVQVPQISEYNKVLELKTTKAIFKETFGITKYRYGYEHNLNPDDIKMRMAYECANGKILFEFGYDKYTQEDIEILQSDEHCLDYMYGYRMFTSKQECYDSVLLRSSIEAGLSCGYFKYTLKYSDGTTLNIESCGIFNRDLINQQNLDNKSKESIQTFVNSNKGDGKIVLSYEVNLSNKEGQYIVYDSALDRITSSNSSRNLTFNYLLFIIIGLLI